MLGVVHTTWPVVPGRFKDYISTPKQNDYRSIHTTVIGPGKQRVELQIRTAGDGRDRRIRHRRACALQGRAVSPTEMLSRESNAYAWLRRTIELLAEGDTPEEFLEHTKLELFHDQVFCFTPEGPADRAAARRDADRFRLCGAYRCRQHGGRRKINGKIAPLASELQNGDEVEIVTSKAQRRRRRPGNRSSSPARRAPRSAAPRATRCARNMPASAAGSSSGCSSAPRSDYSDEKLNGALPRLARASVDDVMAAVGRGEMKASVVARAMYPGLSRRSARRWRRPRATSGWFGLGRAKAVKVQGRGRLGRTASRSAASTATCRCASRRMAAPCRATASSAS